MLPGGERATFYSAGRGKRDGRFTLDRAQQEILLPLLARSGRCRLAGSGPERILVWEEHDEPWRPGVRLVRDEHGGESRLEAFLGRDSERLPIEAPERLFPAGFVLHEGTLARLDPRGAAGWLVARWREGPRRVPREREAELIDELAGLRAFPWIELEEAAEDPPLPLLEIQGARDARDGRLPLTCRVLFDYGGTRVRPAEPRAVLLGARDGLPRRRNAASEAARMTELTAAGALGIPVGEDVDAIVEVEQLGGVVRALLELGWRVEAEGRNVRRASAAGYRVTSGIDWFELAGSVEYDGASAPVAALALAARSGARMVLLGDGSLGLLPEEWLARWGLIAAAGAVEGEGLRFARSQAFLLEAACGERAGPAVPVEVDAGFASLRAELARFTRLEPHDEPAGFHGSLRPYQRLSLAWFELLRAAGLGGCLADEMGLGKTVQVLALLQERRRLEARTRRTSLVVAPRSLVTNWIREAARFAPELVAREYGGPGREAALAALEDTDLLVTSYGVLRRDESALAGTTFDYVILDEAQAIKNASTDSARAARSLSAAHRLALSGTPIENHLGELGSLLEFLSPGLLGRVRAFDVLRPEAGAQHSGVRAELVSALRPLILRRTKAQVLPELPEKSEQVLWCEPGEREAAAYATLRDELRAALLAKVEAEGVARSKWNALEALLRLRQAACHPALVDPLWPEAECAKLDVLVAHLEEIRACGHKALVFSQFTRFLALVRRALERSAIPYQYLDGSTQKRAERVDAFQSDPDCTAFLISLKAGGTGLNLTAADYVFLLDPWWNPAVESQAIDRTHRIGQTRKVLAYRLIARGSVEEKVLELQEAKRELVRSVLGEGGSLLRELTRADLEALLS